MEAEWEGMKTPSNSQISRTPVLAAVTYYNLQSFPESKCLKLLLPFPQGE